MKTLNKYKLVFCTLFFLVLLAKPKADAQIIYRQSPDSEIIIDGKSTLRDWSMISDEGKYNVEFEIKDGKLVKLNSLSFNLRVKSLKSGSSALDKNAYSTLNADTHQSITYTLTSAVIGPQKIQCRGNLNVAGFSRPVDLEAIYELTSDQSILCSGSKTLQMSDYKIDPPVFMFGTVRTSDEIKVTFKVRLVPLPLH